MVSLREEVEIKSFIDKQKLEKFISIKQVLQGSF